MAGQLLEMGTKLIIAQHLRDVLGCMYLRKDALIGERTLHGPRSDDIYTLTTHMSFNAWPPGRGMS